MSTTIIRQNFSLVLHSLFNAQIKSQMTYSLYFLLIIWQTFGAETNEIKYFMEIL
ncbi:MAG: hypothetical protein ACJA2S_002294 [Cyclobacteriaceae bacterium]|jgi:hypothetical protein